jgi:hypothetical protein
MSREYLGGMARTARASVGGPGIADGGAVWAWRRPCAPRGCPPHRRNYVFVPRIPGGTPRGKK